MKNSHLVDVLAKPFVRRSAATPPLAFLRGDDLTVFEQPKIEFERHHAKNHEELSPLMDRAKFITKE